MAETIGGGNATVFIDNMDAAVHFYTDILGLKLSSRYGDQWATVEAGRFTIGLHPASKKHPSPGTKGSIMIGLQLNEPIEQAAERLRAQQVHFLGDILRGDEGSFIHFEDPSGNELYLWESPKY